jgi:hypothetical protein
MFKLIVIAAIILGGGALLGTRKETPFMRLGIIAALAGVLLMAATTLFAVRSLWFGVIVAIVGVALYYYGRIVRRETLFVAKPK